MKIVYRIGNFNMKIPISNQNLRKSYRKEITEKKKKKKKFMKTGRQVRLYDLLIANGNKQVKLTKYLS